MTDIEQLKAQLNKTEKELHQAKDFLSGLKIFILVITTFGFCVAIREHSFFRFEQTFGRLVGPFLLAASIAIVIKAFWSRFAESKDLDRDFSRAFVSFIIGCLAALGFGYLGSSFFR